MNMSRLTRAWSASAKRAVVAALAAASLLACTPSSADEVSTQTLLGTPVALGHGTARTYIVMQAGEATEVGVVLTEASLHGLPGAHDAGGVHVHGHTTFETVLSLPKDNPTPYRHVLVNWNPGGHEPPGIYDTEHLDFHFYTLEDAERMAIDPADPEYQVKAERQPSPDLVPEGYVLPAPLAFPRMGVHWVDPASPELNGSPFTHTFIFGSWNGEVIFAEPMITKAFLESKQSVRLPVPSARRYADPGRYPTAYSIDWDPATKEYRIALTGLEPRD